MSAKKILFTRIGELVILSSGFFISGESVARSLVKHSLYFYEHYQWGVLYYYGKTVKDPLARIPVDLFQLKSASEDAQSLEIDYTLSANNGFRRFFSPYVNLVQIAANITVRQGKNEPTIYEFDPYLCFRWVDFKWDSILTTSFAIGEGLSYTTTVPASEQKSNTNTKHLLNYLMLEATIAPPHFPELQLVIRIHHRSGAYGLYQAGNTGSNIIGLGLRYLF